MLSNNFVFKEVDFIKILFLKPTVSKFIQFPDWQKYSEILKSRLNLPSATGHKSDNLAMYIIDDDDANRIHIGQMN